MTDLDFAHLSRVLLPPSVRIERGVNGLPRLTVDSRFGTAQIYFQGAHVTAWHPVGAQAPVLWISRESQFDAGKPIRGGVPICFPWFGAHATDAAAPGHGFARLREWTLVEADDKNGVVTLTLELTTADAPPPQWPHAFRMTHRVTIGERLEMALTVSNAGREPFTFEEALHTYFAVQDVREVSVTGLSGVEYLDKVTGFSRHRQADEPIRFTAETDRIYLATRADCVIHDPGKRRRLTIRKEGSDATVVWNPWIAKARAMPDFGDAEWPEMVCVETCNVDAHRVTLAPGASHTMTASIDAGAL